MADYATFCDHYGYDPRTAAARDAYAEYQNTLRDLHATAASARS